MQKQALDRGIAVLYAVTIFLSAFLLFQVQPILGKFILPWFGGSPAVWTTCMLVYQVLLFGGYAYAHVVTQYLTPRKQAVLHACLLAGACCLLPITPDASWKPDANDSPAWRIILLTICTVGVPYFLLSSTGPLVQSWFSRKLPQTSPFRLYALSNLGSLIALLSYPFVIEPSLATPSQAWIWSILFAIFACLCAGCAATMWQVQPLQSARETSSDPASETATSLIATPSTDTIVLWFCLAMLPSVLLLAMTNQVCQDVAVVPFLWVVPLALYLLTFILVFDAKGWYSRWAYSLAAAVLIGISSYMTAFVAWGGLLNQLLVYFSTLFCCCMVCHGELVNLKPDPRFLTKYYLIISAGGAAGGLFVGLLAPVIFSGYYELKLAFVAFGLVFVALKLKEERKLVRSGSGWAYSLLSLAILGGVGIWLTKQGAADGALVVKRNFYGVLRVRDNELEEPERHGRKLVHGRILHGFQFLSPEKQKIATTYYGTESGVGMALKSGPTDKPRHLGMIGLGVGTLACYGRASDKLRFYEINPDVIDLAQQYFTYLKDCPGEVTIRRGDARLVLEYEEPQAFDVLVLDAFSGDAIPVHLLTKEAWEIYLRHLKPDGILACHISNLHFDLYPVVHGLVDKFQLSLRTVSSSGNDDRETSPALWCLISRDPSILQACLGDTEDKEGLSTKIVIWTDDRNNLLEVLKSR